MSQLVIAITRMYVYLPGQLRALILQWISPERILVCVYIHMIKHPYLNVLNSVIYFFFLNHFRQNKETPNVLKPVIREWAYVQVGGILVSFYVNT